MYVVSLKGDIKEDINTSGDEAMVLAQALPKASVIVSKDRKIAILKAKELGAKIIFLDDGFSKSNILKFDILIRPKIEPTNIFCLPSGGYRDTKMLYAMVDMVMQDGKDFKRVVTITKDNIKINKLPKDILILTSISKPNRLKEFVNKDIKIVSFLDHYQFTQNDIDATIKNNNVKNILTTQKDYVKLKQLDLNNITIYIMQLDIEFLNPKILVRVKEYYESYFN
jgi:tetraacyldisaccharide 4'-kinase